MKAAIVHDWLNGMRGGEKCLEEILDLFPEAPIYTIHCDPEKLSKKIQAREIRTSWVQNLPWRKSKYRYYLPLFPWAIQSFDLSSYDLIFSISHCVSKGVRVRKGQKHICYCLTPMRYLWGFQNEYFNSGPYDWTKFLGRQQILEWLKRWDIKTAQNVTSYIAISNHVRDRIKTVYGRDSQVVYPPVDCDRFYYQESENRKDYFLIVSALVPYKRIDLAIETFNQLALPLKIIGAGTELPRLKAMSGPNIEFLGWRSDEDLRRYYTEARALIFPGEEDFGIAPLEAQACGTPVIAFKQGGALETVRENMTGVFFDQQSAASLTEAIEKNGAIHYDRRTLRSHALMFDRSVFLNRVRQYLMGP